MDVYSVSARLKKGGGGGVDASRWITSWGCLPLGNLQSYLLLLGWLVPLLGASSPPSWSCAPCTPKGWLVYTPEIVFPCTPNDWLVQVKWAVSIVASSAWAPTLGGLQSYLLKLCSLHTQRLTGPHLTGKMRRVNRSNFSLAPNGFLFSTMTLW